MLQPRTPDDRALCRAEAAPVAGGAAAGQLGLVVRPRKEVKSRQGKRKPVKTKGYASPNNGCEYYMIRLRPPLQASAATFTDGEIHEAASRNPNANG